MNANPEQKENQPEQEDNQPDENNVAAAELLVEEVSIDGMCGVY